MKIRGSVAFFLETQRSRRPCHRSELLVKLLGRVSDRRDAQSTELVDESPYRQPCETRSFTQAQYFILVQLDGKSDPDALREQLLVHGNSYEHGAPA